MLYQSRSFRSIFVFFLMISVVCDASKKPHRKGHNVLDAGYGYAAFDPRMFNSNPILYRVEGFKAINDAIESVVRDIARLDREIREKKVIVSNTSSVGGDSVPSRIEVPLSSDQVAEKVREKEKMMEFYKTLSTRRISFLEPTSLGKLIARGIAGEDAEFVEDSDIKNWADGLLTGFTVRVAKATGDVFSDKVTGTLQTVLGGAWDYTFGKLIDVWNYLCYVIFHDGNVPFLVDEIVAWQEMIKEVFGDIELILKDGLRDSLRGHDMTLRQFDVGKNGEYKEDEKDDEEKNVTLWMYLMRGYAQQFDRFVDEIERRKRYYKDDTLEVFYASQIQARLLEFRNVLLKAESLRSFDTLIESNKSMVVAESKNIISLFKRLEDLVRPRTYSLDKKSNSSDLMSRGLSKSKYHQSGFYGDRYDGFPSSML